MEIKVVAGPNQHYVPRFLLKNFSEKKQVYRFDKRTGRVEHKSIRSVCSQDHFYNLTLTEVFENQPKIKQAVQKTIKDIPKDAYFTCDKAITEVETKTGEIVKKVLAYKNLTVLNDKEKFMLCLFTSLQMLRTSHHRNDIKTMMEAMAKKVKEFYDAGIGGSGSYEDWQEKNIGRSFDISAKFMNITKLGEEATNCAKILFLSKNMFLIDVLDENLYISDCPVVFNNQNDFRPWGNIGLLVRGIEIYLPLSSHIILAYHCKSLLPPFKLLVGCTEDFYKRCEAVENGGCIYERDEQHLFNYLQVCYSDRYLVAKHNNFDYAESLIKQDPRFRECISKLEVK